jgi:hypothetical protein
VANQAFALVAKTLLEQRCYMVVKGSLSAAVHVYSIDAGLCVTLHEKTVDSFDDAILLLRV